jgi:hypothetical protein
MRLTCLALLLALPACGDDTAGTATTTGSDTGTSQAEAGSSGAPVTSTDSPTTDGTGTATGETTDSPTAATSSGGDVTTAPATGDTSVGTTDASDTSTGADTGTTAGGTDTGTTDDSTTGGVMGCGFDGPRLDATLVHNNNQPPPPCGTVEFTGQNMAMSPGPVYALDGCPCGNDCFAPDPWTFSLDVPAGALPLQMPVCPRIVMERTMSKAGCELVGVAIWELDPASDIDVPWYVAGSLLGPIAAVQADLDVAQISVEDCAECDGCCNDGARYDLEFSALGDSLVLPENGAGTLDKPGDDFHYNVTNYQSHLTGICDDSPQIDWIVSLELEP